LATSIILWRRSIGEGPLMLRTLNAAFASREWFA
jgi:hypothetical protein